MCIRDSNRATEGIAEFFGVSIADATGQVRDEQAKAQYIDTLMKSKALYNQALMKLGVSAFNNPVEVLSGNSEIQRRLAGRK